MKTKDVIILKKILDYCRQLDEACDMFDNDYNNFIRNSVFQNACCMCILQIGELCKVISEELPDAMQVADRFHLHQNLLEAIKKALNHELPATVSIPHVGQSTAIEEPCKKNRI